MAEYIEREAAVSFIRENQCKKCSDIGLCGNCAVLTAIKLFESVPSADVQPVRHGRWTDIRTIEHDGNWYCSVCDKEITIYMGPNRTDRYRYCPNCGAKMDGGET